MSGDDRSRWDAQHGLLPGSAHPSAFLRQIFASDVWPINPGCALDVACGKGRNAVYLAERGFQVVAVDISPVALTAGRQLAEAKGLSIDWRQADLEVIELGCRAYDLIINFNYLQRALTEPMKRAVKIGGRIIFETFLIDQKSIGHPKNPDYLLGHNELLNAFRDFRVLHYHEGRFPDGDGASFRAGILAQRER